jgi:hypothetical protein
MGKRNSKGDSKKSKSKKHREKSNESNLSKRQKNSHNEYISENISESSVEQNENNDINGDEGILENIDTNTTESTAETSPPPTPTSTDTDINDCCEEIKAKQQELFDKLRNLSEAVAAITLIRDNVNSISVDTLTELYFTRQVRPLLDALNIISFASYNMSYTATTYQSNAFGERKEIKKSLKLSYRMNDEVDDIINVVARRLAIFLSQINNMDKSCPPFDFNKDS